MDYEQKYKEAQGWIEKIYPTLQYEQQMEAEAFFPELKESEDEKIRKLLIRLFTSNANEKFDDVSTQEIIAWLERKYEGEFLYRNK